MALKQNNIRGLVNANAVGIILSGVVVAAVGAFAGPLGLAISIPAGIIVSGIGVGVIVYNEVSNKRRESNNTRSNTSENEGRATTQDVSRSRVTKRNQVLPLPTIREEDVPSATSITCLEDSPQSTRRYSQSLVNSSDTGRTS